MKYAFTLAITMLGAFYLQAQQALKIGYADVEYIFSQMPESKTIESELQALQTQLKKGIDAQVANFQKKVAEYQQFGANVPEAVRQNTEREIRQIQDNIEKLQQDAQAEMQRKQTQLMEPVYQKVGKAIEDVAKENGFSLILNNQISGLDVILYGDEKLDVSDLVLKKLGITPKPATGNK
ncbi:MAG: OmpH family outer membrane protein [Cyclobacteriaceae bacterium]|nr:OmpH family outer membrane protein [Cyclobacteriaceae bacterium]MCX7637718.1 OmpH family outer membrane protein [Cyclobacteriaceae bacterium]MDW8330817.1 OmpH family outer membrane protein [Cyclobacteriaceae bacterium]